MSDVLVLTVCTKAADPVDDEVDGTSSPIAANLDLGDLWSRINYCTGPPTSVFSFPECAESTKRVRRVATVGFVGSRCFSGTPL